MVTIDFFPLDFEHIEFEGQGYIYIFGRECAKSDSERGKKLCVRTIHDSYCYIRTQGIDKEQLVTYLEETQFIVGEGQTKQSVKVTNIEKINKRLFAKTEEFLKITVPLHSALKEIEAKLNQKRVDVFEADINPVQRFLIDNKITPLQELSCEAELKPETNEITLPLFHTIANSLHHNTDNRYINPTFLAIDIETYNEVMQIDMDKNPILMIALYGINDQGKILKKVLTYKNFKTTNLDIEHLASEKEMLERTAEIIDEFDPDMFTTYFGDGFDFPYIQKRAHKFGVPFEIGKNKTVIQLPRNRQRARVVGIPHIDIFKFIRYIFGTSWRLDSYSLDNVAQELLGEKKHKIDLSKLAMDWNNNSNLQMYAEYNLQDTKLTFDITKKVFSALAEFSSIVQVPPDDLIRMRFSRLVEAYLLKRGGEMNIINPNKPSAEAIAARRQKHIQGAFVFEPKPGLYKDMVVFDFLSLYPTVIVSHNIGAETVTSEKPTDPKTFWKVPERNYYINKEPKAMMATVLAEIIDKRVALKLQRKELIKNNQDVSFIDSRLYSLKILANSFYGYFAFYGARWYSFEGADSITAFARNYIKRVIKQASDAGFHVVYSDTDSVMIALEDKTQEQAHQFVNKINTALPGAMELEFEGYFPRAIFVGVRGSEGGAKKKYALIDENNKMKITGFATVRRNTSQIAKEMQKEFLRYVLTDKIEEGIKYLKKQIKEIQAHHIPLEKMIIKTQLTRPLESYKSIGPHIAVAQQMKTDGIAISKGMLIEYVVQEGTGLVRNRARQPSQSDKPYDVNYYLKNQVIPALSAILAVIDRTEDEIVTKDGATQKGLGSFT